ncbi:(deoxy)nucleoside triphosphate pyrophosphohydrolase [Spirochaeta cellobiosiphila]|uniref:(deoxy)nucleoside triphosphate pyrophosphohydrolase n=1 Tax=Spirochaeta cellobiosiphila TaxID=504483 RepID=UPI000422245D|nr:(deoxy)nucleoside triphosphate pyrophosphohydrolase [Spirochaeta cellobiosiphila]
MPTRPIVVVTGILEKEGKYLITRRKMEQNTGDQWEFPGGKVQSKESDQKALMREFKEELGLTVEVSQFLCEINFTFANGKPGILRAYTVEYQKGNMTLYVHEEARYIFPHELGKYDFTPAYLEILDKLQQMSYSKVINRAEQLRNEGEHQKALELLQDLSNSQPKNPIIHYHLAWTLQSMGEEDSALTHYVKALEYGLEGDKRRETIFGLAIQDLFHNRLSACQDKLNQAAEECGFDYDIQVFHSILDFKKDNIKSGLEQLVNVIIETTSSESVKKYKQVLQYLIQNW